MTIDEIKNNLEDAFIQTDLYDQFEYGVDSCLLYTSDAADE